MVHVIGFGLQTCIQAGWLNSIEHVVCEHNIWSIHFYTSDIPFNACAVTKVGFESSRHTINEGNTTSVCLTLDKNLEREISVCYTLEAVMTFGNNQKTGYFGFIPLIYIQIIMKLFYLKFW